MLIVRWIGLHVCEQVGHAFDDAILCFAGPHGFDILSEEDDGFYEPAFSEDVEVLADGELEVD